MSYIYKKNVKNRKIEKRSKFSFYFFGEKPVSVEASEVLTNSLNTLDLVQLPIVW